MSALVPSRPRNLITTEPRADIRRGIELGFFQGRALVYDGTEPVAIDAQAGKGKLTRFLGVNLVSPRTQHLTKIITDPKDGELAWISWKTLRDEGYRVRFLNAPGLHGYPSESFNPNTKLLEVAADPARHKLLFETAYDCASFLIPMDPNPNHRWIGQGGRTACALYLLRAALIPSRTWPCTPGGLWDFFGRGRDDICDDLLVWAADGRMANQAGLCRLIASFTQSPDQWNAYASVFLERLQPYQPGAAARTVTDINSFDPDDMKRERTALFLMGSATSEASRSLVGVMAAAIINRFVEARGPLRALVIGEEWGQLYVSNFYEILTLYRQGGINFVGVFQNAAAQIETRYGRETARLWKKAVAHILYRGLPDSETLKEIEHRSGRTSVMVRGFNVNQNQVNGSGDSLGEQSRPLLQVEDIRRATGGETGLLDSRDSGFFEVDIPEFWERPEVSSLLRDVREKPDKYHWLGSAPQTLPSSPTSQDNEGDEEIEAMLARLRRDA